MSAGAAREELEAALTISADDPGRVAGEVAALSSIAGYRLRPGAPQPIHDLYLDTPQRGLLARRIALRLRTIARDRFVTVKGPPRQTAWGAVERLELEARWSAESLNLMIEALRGEGVTLPRASGRTGAPIETLRALGLDVVQDRRTHRRPRAVTRADDPRGVALAELAVDAVVYRLETAMVHLHQVEIEARSADGAPVVRAIVDRLATQFAPALRPWPYGKLVTGEAIARLLRTGSLTGLIGADGTLLPAGIERITLALTREGP